MYYSIIARAFSRNKRTLHKLTLVASSPPNLKIFVIPAFRNRTFLVIFVGCSFMHRDQMTDAMLNLRSTPTCIIWLSESSVTDNYISGPIEVDRSFMVTSSIFSMQIGTKCGIATLYRSDDRLTVETNYPATAKSSTWKTWQWSGVLFPPIFDPSVRIAKDPLSRAFLFSLPFLFGFIAEEHLFI